LRIELRLAVRDRARFLSHLECVEMLLTALRRAGFEVALSQGLRPKPVISMALARAVGVASEDELCTVELTGDVDVDDVADRLSEALPRGLEVVSAAPSDGTPRVVGARYAVALEAPAETVERAAAVYAGRIEAPIGRRSPKGDRTIDVKAFAPSVEPVEGGFEVEIALTDEGSARPEEVARALAECAGAPLPVTGITRIQIHAARPVRAGAAGETT